MAGSVDETLRYGEFAITHAGLVNAAILVGVVFVISLALKHAFAVFGERMTRANPVASALFTAVARGTHLLIFALTLRGVTPAQGSASVFGLTLGSWTPIADKTADLLLVIAFSFALLHLVGVPVAWFKCFADRTESKLDDMLVPVVDKLLRVLVVLGSVVEIISTLSGSPPAQIVAPLAVGGLAIGLAAQDTVKNFFGAVMLIVDKPFTLGDVINIGSHTGVVESLGLRSTRIRTVDGHLVSVPNGDLANRAIQNVAERKSIRHAMSIGLEYSTPVAKIDEAAAILRELLTDHEGSHADFPARVHLEKLADYSINLQIIYWFHPADYWKYMEFNQRLLFSILRRFEAAGIGFAFPTQTIELKKDSPK